MADVPGLTPDDAHWLDTVLAGLQADTPMLSTDDAARLRRLFACELRAAEQAGTAPAERPRVAADAVAHALIVAMMGPVPNWWSARVLERMAAHGLLAYWQAQEAHR
jgi:hypothetical protein